MYCPTCGAPAAPGLKYCNRCGANLAPAAEPHGPRLGGLAWALPLAVGLVTLGGLGALFIVGMEFAGRSSNIPAGIGVVLLTGFLAVFVIDWMLIRQLSRVIDIYHSASAAPARERPAPPAPQQQQPPARLEAPRQPADSIGEHTTRTLGVGEQQTRTFEPSARERDQS